eukprot:CFRG8307T1
MTGHSNDCPECDNRLALVPGRKHAKGSQHLVYGLGAVYPRAHNNRSAVYMHSPDQPVLAYIPEVEETYGVWENTYTLINEVGLSMGESTCDSHITAAGIDTLDTSTGQMGDAMLSITALMRLGLERCANAVCAIETMGALAEEHGFYGEGFMTGEAVTLADTTGDAWVFHIVQSYTVNTSAVWVAQRVPDGHIAVVANQFTIKNIPFSTHAQTNVQSNQSDGSAHNQMYVDLGNFKHSTNMYDEARASGMWVGQEGRDAFSWQKVFGGDNKPLYATVRMQWMYSQVAPSLNIAIADSVFEMPFSVQVDIPITVRTLMNMYRTHYEGTDHDMTKGILSGPFGNPHRVSGVDVGTDGMKTELRGQITRGIGVVYTAYVHIGYAHPTRSVSWFALDEPANSVFVPLLTSTLVEAKLIDLEDTANLYSRSYQIGARFKFDLKSAWWIFNMVANWLNINYQLMSSEFVAPAVVEWQEVMFAAYNLGTTAATKAAQDNVVSHWNEMFHTLVVRYNDGMYNYYPGADPRMPVKDTGYPVDFLEEIGYDNSFWLTKTFGETCNLREKNEYESTIVLIAIGILTLCLAIAFGFVLGWLARACTMKDIHEEKQPLLL